MTIGNSVSNYCLSTFVDIINVIDSRLSVVITLKEVCSYDLSVSCVYNNRQVIYIYIAIHLHGYGHLTVYLERQVRVLSFKDAFTISEPRHALRMGLINGYVG